MCVGVPVSKLLNVYCHDMLVSKVHTMYLL